MTSFISAVFVAQLETTPPTLSQLSVTPHVPCRGTTWDVMMRTCVCVRGVHGRALLGRACVRRALYYGAVGWCDWRTSTPPCGTIV